jgi:UDP-N-acetylmuramoyl-L-alanyl-D-glutamate--2,6-diaminopimelate ligase
MTFDDLLALVCSKQVQHICTDSRTVKDGSVFIAVKGTVYDGHEFIDQATANGAKYVVGRTIKPDIKQRNSEVHFVTVDDVSKAAAILAQAARDNPASKLINLAVTGTNGKTTVAYLVRSCIRQAGQKCGLIGTVIYDTCLPDELEDAPLTTPDCLYIADKQQQMVNNGAKYMVIEASSHALSQNRLAGINFKAAAFTNLSGDHLDYHKTKEDYLAAKTKLFCNLSTDAAAILNGQSPETDSIAANTTAKILRYAVDKDSDISAHIDSMDINGTVFTLRYQGQSTIVKSPLPGMYNVSNCLAAAGLCLAAGFDLDTIAQGLSAQQTIPGRLEKIESNADFAVLVDYAHTDDALKNVLATLKPLCEGNLIVVFGCGGDRDKTKRPRMAKVAEQLADQIIVTSDNPRTENPEQIISDIVAGLESPNSDKVTIEADRKKAIELAIKTAAGNDIVLIAGKGHETYQIIGKQKFHFSDKKIAREFLSR